MVNIIQILNLKRIKKFVQLGSSAEYGNLNSPLKETAINVDQTPHMQLLSIYVLNILLNLNEKEISSHDIKIFQVYGPKQDDNRIIPFLIKNCLKNKKKIYYYKEENKFAIFVI